MLDNAKAIVVFIFVFVFCSNLHQALEEMVPAIREIYWFVLLFGLSAVFLLLSPVEAIKNMPKPAFIWVLIFLTSTLIAYTLSSRSPRSIIELTGLLKSLSVFFGMFVLLTQPKIVKTAFYSLLLVIIVNASVNLLEFFTEAMEWSGIPGRAAGWHMNANKSGKFLVMGLIFAAVVVPRKLLWPLILFTAVGIIVTFSRSTWVELFFVIVGISLINSTPIGQKINLLNIKLTSFVAMVVGGIIATMLLVSVFSGQAYELIKDTPMEQYLSTDTIGRMSGDLTDDSMTERKRVLFVAAKVGLDNPIAGAGLSYTYDWDFAVAPHNDYAKLFAERGVTGLLMYLLLLGILWHTGGRHAKLFVIVLAFSSIATHNTFEQPGLYIFIALSLLYKEGSLSLKPQTATYTS